MDNKHAHITHIERSCMHSDGFPPKGCLILHLFLLFTFHVNSVMHLYFNYLTIYDAFLFVSTQFILPYLLGWHAFANSIKPEDSGRTNIASSRYGGDFEWSRK